MPERPTEILQMSQDDIDTGIKRLELYANEVSEDYIATGIHNLQRYSDSRYWRVLDKFLRFFDSYGEAYGLCQEQQDNK